MEVKLRICRRVRNIAKRDLTTSYLSVRMEQLGCYWMEFYETLYMRIFRKYVEKIRVSLRSEKKTDTLHEDQYIFFIISRSFLLRMWNVSCKSCRENQNTHFVFGNFFFKKIVPLRDNVKKYCRTWQATDYSIIRRMRLTWITKATHTYSEYVILFALARQ